MSYWTNVRILYDVEVGYPKHDNRIMDSENEMRYLGLTQLYETARRKLFYKKRGIYQLGSEGPVDIDLKVVYGSGTYNGNKSIVVDDRGQIVIIGNLRDCMKEEFVEALNEFRKTLRNYGIFITAGLVSIT